MEYMTQTLHLPLSIIDARFKGDTLVAVDMSPTLYTFSATAELVSHSSLGGIESLDYRYTKQLALSHDARYTLVCDSQNAKALLIDLQSKKVLTQIKMQKSPKFALFSSDGRYCIVANAVGRVALYDISALVLYDEFAFPDELSSASFSEDSSQLVVTTLDRGLFIYDVATKKIDKKAELGDIAELVTIAPDGSTLLLFMRSGKTLKYLTATSELLSTEPSYEWVSAAAQSSHAPIVVVGTRSSELFVYSAQRGEILGRISFEFWGISSVCVRDDKLFVGFSDGNGVLLDATKEIAEAIALLKEGNIAQLCGAVAESVLIFLDRNFCTLLVENYKEVLSYKPQSISERAGYDALVSLVLGDQEHQREYLKELYSSDEMITFQEIFNQGRVKEACKIAHATPILHQLKEYTQLRKSCYEQQEKSLRMLEKNPHEFKEYLESLQTPCKDCEYATAFSADLIEAYNKLKKSAEAMSYATIFEIVNLYPIFRQTKLFARMMHYGESLIDKTVIMLSANKSDEALKYATKLSLMKPFAKTGNDFKNQISLYTKFEKACKSQNIAQICSVVKEQPALRATKLFKEQIARYNEYEKPAIALAKKGDKAGVLKYMNKYAEVEYFAQRLDTLKRLALLYEIKNYAPEGEERELLEEYYRCFGWDEHYESVAVFFELEIQKEPKREAIDASCYNKETFLRGERVKRKEHVKETGEQK